MSRLWRTEVFLLHSLMLRRNAGASGRSCTLIAFVVAKAIASVLLATSPWDLPSYLGMAMALLLVALASGYVPARRASSITPMEALRNN